MKLCSLLSILIALSLFSPCQTWMVFTRRRRSCSPSSCSVSSWGSWSGCSNPCGGGTQTRSRHKTVSESCGGSCNYKFKESRRCNTQCCRMNCVYSWGAWSKCTGCGTSTQSRTPNIKVSPSCGGTSCPGRQTQSCNTGVCCPVNCVVNTWGNWGSCSAACEQTGKQTRTRSVRTNPACKGTACPTLVESRPCKGGCCRRDCLVSKWSSWNKCNAPPGKCSANSGTRSRLRSISRQPSCGGSACPSLAESGKCTPVPISCLVSSWSSFGKCTPKRGNCGPGTQVRTRSITRSPYCSSPCPTPKETRSCSAGCCPVNCVVSGWTGWTSCTATCGSGTKSRTRSITTQPSCNGQACPTLKSTTPCTQYNNKDCVMSSWSSWTQCSNGCGNGLVTKTRSVISQAVCQGRKCGPTSVSKVCTSYRENRDCVVGSWSSWGVCSAKCAVGSRQRTRAITNPQRCKGRPCPSLRESSTCGSANGGCQHTCSNGVCSCHPGYTPNKKTCTPKNCGNASPRYCAQGTKLGSTCKYAIVTCPGGNTTYPVTCSMGCPKYYSLKGTSTITCQTNGLWTRYSSTYCRRNNDPPTQILLSGSSSVAENQPRGTKIGTFSSVDPVNSKDVHTYRMTKGGSGLVELRGANLLTLKSFNYESSPNTFDITVRSTDNGIPAMYLDKTFSIRVTDVNEAPTDIQLSSTSVDENSDVDTTVGKLSTADPDTSQSFTYQLLSNAAGCFKVVNNLIKVAQSNKLCLQSGGSKCMLNYEQQKSYAIQVRSTDSGSPSKSIQITFYITINDVNDKPRDLKLSNQKIKENAPINSVVGQLSARDEDFGQRLVFSLDNDDNGRFKVDSNGRLLKAKPTDYETSKVHQIVVRVTDNGKPAMSISKQISIVVLNVNEPPVSVTLDNTNVKENSPKGTRVAMVTALDNDAVQILTFTLDDDAGGKFSLGNNSTCKNLTQGSTQCTTVLQVSGDLDFEDAQWETITVRVTDDSGLFNSMTINITVTDVNDKPTNVSLEGSLAATVTENSRDLEIGELQTVDQDHGQTFTYTLLSNGGGNFEVRGVKLYVTKSANLDYEKVQSYQVRLRSTDSGNPPYSIETTLTITVSDLNEAPTDISISNTKVLENKPLGTVIGSLSITDPDNFGPQGARQTHTCQLTNSSNGMIGISVNKNVNQLTVGVAGVNYEAKSIVGISVQCSDPKGLSFQKSLNIVVQDVNEAPTKITVSNLNVKENQAIPTVIGKITVVDPDNEKTQRQTFSLSMFGSPASPFAIQKGNLVTTKKLDFESKAQWSLLIHAQDSGKPAKSKVQQFTVQVVDANDRPSSIQISNALLDENSDQDTLIGTLSTVDQDLSQSHTYTCVDCANGRFKIDKNELRVAQSNKPCLAQGGTSCTLDYEAAKKHRINIRSTDDGIPPYDVNTTLYVILRDVNDQPRDLKLSNNKVQENATINTLIGQLSARDEDAGQSLTFSLVDDDGGRFKVDASGKLYKAKSTNYETQKTHGIRAVVTDNGSPAMKMEKALIIEVLDVNEAPASIQITSTGGQVSYPINSPRVKENSAVNTSIGTLVAIDVDTNQTLTYKLDDNANGMFVLDSSTSCVTVTNMPGYNTKCTSLLKLNGPLNYEQTKIYSVTVRVTDNHGLFTAQTLTVSVIDQNDPPTNITLSSTSINENSNGALVGVLTTTDEDTSQSYSYTLTNDAAGRFDVQGSKLYVSPTANLDFEKQSSFVVTVQVQDSGSPSLRFSKDFSISVRDLNEAPTAISLSNNHVTENSVSGTVIGSFNVSDPDNLGPKGPVQSHVCSVVGSQIGKFVIQKNVLKLGNAVVNFEQASSLDVLVSCTDSGRPSLSLTKTMAIVVDDVNENPSNISLSSNTIAENTPPSFVGTLSTADPDNEGSIRQYFKYRMVGSTTGFPFVIDGSALNTSRRLNYEVKTSWTLTIQSTDNGRPQKSVATTFVISVVDVNEPPTIVTLTQSVVKENSDKDTVIGTLSCQDPDANQTHTYTLTDTASGRFKLAQDKLTVATSNANCLKYGGNYCQLNFEAQRQHIVRVRTTDNGVPPQSKEQTFTISVSDVNDRPRDLRLSGYSVKENATVGTRIGRFSATDEDLNQVLFFTLVDDDNGRFVVDKDSYLIKAKGTDYETSKAHLVIAQVKDNGTQPLTLTKNITISVQNINEAPVNTSIISQGGQQHYPDNLPQVNENSPTGTIVGTLVSLDHDEAQTLKFTLVEDAAGAFSLGSSIKCQNQTNTPGVKSKCTVSLLVKGKLNYEKSKSEDILVKVTDPSGLSHTQKFTVKVLDMNDKPSDVALFGGDVGYVDENANNALVGDLTTVDEDANQVHTYRLINNGGWKFVVRGNKVFTSMYANLDYEKKSAYSISVRAIDDGRPRLYVDKTFTIKVKDVNEKPTDILLSSLNVSENSPIRLPVGKISVIDPDNNGPRGPWQVHACIIVNNVPFIVNQSTNELIVAGSLNHELTPTIDVILRCHDNGSAPLYLEKTLTIKIVDVNEAPTSISLSGSTVAENSGVVTIGTLHTIDPDNLVSKVQTFSYSLKGGSGLPFGIDGNTLKTTRRLDYEARASWQVTIQSTDNKGLSVNKNFIITVTDRNDAPSALNISGPLSIVENSVLGAYVGKVSTVDQDVGQTYTYHIESVSAEEYNSTRNDSSLLVVFSLDSTTGTITLSSSLNFEQYQKYTLLVRSVDSGSPPLSVTGLIDILVTDVNEAPVHIKLSKHTVFENTPVHTIVGSLFVEDPDNAVIPWQQFTCHVTNPSQSPFEVISHLLLAVAKNVLDYETQNVYGVSVYCSELIPSNTSNYSIATTFTIKVVDVNEPPYNLTISNTTIAENGNSGDVVGVLNVLDPDTPGSGFANVTIRIQDQSPSSGAFKIDRRSLVATKPLNFEAVSAYRLTAIAEDSGNPPLKTNITFDVNVLDMNDAPSSVILTSTGVYENSTAGTTVGTLKALDQDKGQTHIFGVINPTDLFTINGSTLLLKKSSSLDYEITPSINVSIKVTDDGEPPKTSELFVLVKVLDSNDPPSDVIMTSPLSINGSRRIMVPENSPEGTPLANITVVDEDVSQGHTCKLIDGQTWFTIRPSSMTTAQVLVKKAADLNYETMSNTIMTVTVQCTDAGSPPYSKNVSFNVVVSDVNEPPYNITLSGNHTILENLPIGSGLGHLQCQDQDFNQTHVFIVTGNSAKIFEVGPNVTLIVKNASYLDYETLQPNGSITVSILATDNANKPLSVSRDFVLRVIDVNEAPYFYGAGNVSVREDVPLGWCIARIRAKDHDAGQTVALSLLSHQETFELTKSCVNASTNDSTLWYLTNKAPLSYDKTYPSHSYSILIEAKDNAHPPLSFKETFFIPVQRANPCDTKNDCHVNAMCRRVNGTSHTCQCNPGYTGNGWNCTEINECDSNPCDYNATYNATYNVVFNGTCLDYVNAYSCVCPERFTGNTSCTPIDYCASSPCLNGGTCNNVVIFGGTFQCNCVPGYNGTNCSMNIDECKPHPCNERGTCKDGINRFDCSCFEGYSGTQCQRNTKDCADEGKCTSHEVCIPPDESQDGAEDEGLCYEKDFIIPLYFKPDAFHLEQVKSPHWKYSLQRFVKKEMEFPVGDIINDEADTTLVSATDLYFTETSRISLYPLAAKRVRKATQEKIDYTAVYFVVKYNRTGVPVDTFYIALNKTCKDIKTDGTSFEKKTCDSGIEMLARLHITRHKPRTSEQEKDNGSLFGLHPYMFYVVIGVGAMVLLLLITGTALCRRKVVAERRLRAFQTHHELLDNDNLHTDVMQRHQLSNEGEGTGAYNPMYGVTGDVQPRFAVLDNSLYSRPGSANEQKTDGPGFSNPMYESFKPIKNDEDHSKADEKAPEPSSEPEYQTPTKLTDEEKKKKKKKKGGKKKKEIDEEDDIPDIACVNPMFASREIYTDVSAGEDDQDDDDDALYALPKRKQAKGEPVEVTTPLQPHTEDLDGQPSSTVYEGGPRHPLYDTPRKVEGPEGLSNPLYDTTVGLARIDEPIPVDVVSAFGFSASKTIGGEAGQSDC